MGTTATSASLGQTFADLRAAHRIGLLPFIPAGYPDLETTQHLLPALEKAGASAIEIGIPFSDPIADGPVVQEAFKAALTKKLRLADVFASIAAARPTVSVPLICMVSYSIVYRHGPARFCKDARSAGFNGLILPDLPPPEAEAVCEQVWDAGLETILLVAPTTSPQRRRDIARLSTGFIYYLSLSGITGERDRLPPNLEQNLRQLREISALPVCVGFGISKPEHLAQLTPLAEGAIVGSAVVRRMKEYIAAGPMTIAGAVSDYCTQLLASKRRE